MNFTCPKCENRVTTSGPDLPSQVICTLCGTTIYRHPDLRDTTARVVDPTGMQRKRRDAFVALAALVVLVALVFVAKYVFGKDTGEACSSGTECRRVGMRCLQGPQGAYCTVQCDDDTDCPPTWHCGTAQWYRASGAPSRTEATCMRP